MKKFLICKDCLGNGYVKLDKTKLTTFDNTETCTTCHGSGHKNDDRDNINSKGLAALNDDIKNWC